MIRGVVFMKCRNCETEFEGNFCPTCGAKKEMKCKKCGAEYVGDFCTNCGTKTVKGHKLFGFRSNKWYKKTLSIMYMIITGLFAIGGISTINSVNDAVTTTGILLGMLAPYIFLSNFKYRKYIPLFKKHRAGLSFLGMICVYIIISIVFSLLNPATHCEHEWVEVESKQATCSEDGYIKKHCDLCNADNTETISKIEHQFSVVEETEEKIVKKCSSCDETVTEEKKKESEKNEEVSSTTEPKEEKHKHEWQKATCEEPSVCLTCGETKDDTLGHTTDLGICSRCDKEFRKQSPITIINWTYNIDSAGGVEWNLNLKNNTDKQIKYVTLEWNCYNAVGDLIYDEISWKSYYRLRFTGPLDAHSTSTRFCNATKFYNYTFKSSSLSEAIIEYMDGTTEEVTQYHDNIFG